MSRELIEIDCGEVFTTAQCMDIYAQLCVAFEEKQAISINVSKLINIDMSAMQLLYSFQQAAAATSMTVTWTDKSTVFNESLALLGMPDFYTSR